MVETQKAFLKSALSLANRGGAFSFDLHARTWRHENPNLSEKVEWKTRNGAGPI